MDYIKLFLTTEEFESEKPQLKRPYVCLTQDDGKLHYARDPRNVVIMTSETNASVLAICYAQGWCASPDKMTQAEAEAVTNIGNAFKNSQIGSFTEFKYFTGVTSIGGDAFQGSTCTKLHMPDSVTTLGNFRGLPSLTELLLSNNLLGLPQYFQIVCPLNIPKKLQTMYYGGNAQKVYVGITIDPDNTHFTLSDGILYDENLVIKGQVFNSAEITIKDGVTNIPQSLAYENTIVRKITIPSSVTTIESVFCRYATNLKTIIVHAATPPQLDTGLLLQGVTLTSIQVPSASVNTYKATAPWSTYASIIQAIS